MNNDGNKQQGKQEEDARAGNRVSRTSPGEKEEVLPFEKNRSVSLSAGSDSNCNNSCSVSSTIVFDKDGKVLRRESSKTGVATTTNFLGVSITPLTRRPKPESPKQHGRKDDDIVLSSDEHRSGGLGKRKRDPAPKFSGVSDFNSDDSSDDSSFDSRGDLEQQYVNQFDQFDSDDEFDLFDADGHFRTDYD